MHIQNERKILKIELLLKQKVTHKFQFRYCLRCTNNGARLLPKQLEFSKKRLSNVSKSALGYPIAIKTDHYRRTFTNNRLENKRTSCTVRFYVECRTIGNNLSHKKTFSLQTQTQSKIPPLFVYLKNKTSSTKILDTAVEAIGGLRVKKT